MDYHIQQKLGENLRLLRCACGYTQVQVAEELHICRSTYTLYELGRKIPSVDTLVDLAGFYGIRLDVLLDPGTNLYIQRSFSNERSKKDLERLVDIYYRLPPHAQGKLMERADALLELEEIL